ASVAWREHLLQCRWQRADSGLGDLGFGFLDVGFFDESRGELAGDAPESGDVADVEPFEVGQAEAGHSHAMARVFESGQALHKVEASLRDTDFLHYFVQWCAVLDLASDLSDERFVVA